MWIYKSNLSNEKFVSSDSEYSKRYLSELDSEYKTLRDAPLPALTREKFCEYERSGNRIAYESLYFRRRAMLRDFALKAWLGDSEALKLLENAIISVCSEISWALPAHAGREDLKTVIDLFAAETAQTLTEIVSLIGDKLSPSVTEQAISEVKKRVLLPFVNRKKKYNWESMRSNWCAVCGGSVGMTAIYLIEDTAELKHILKGLTGTFENYMKSFSEDGACLEGLYYWGYGMTYLTAFLDLYRQRTGEDFPVNTEKLKKMADFAHKSCISDGVTVSFSDGNERDRIYSGLSSKLTELYGATPIDQEYRAYFLGDDCGRWCRAVRDIAWTNEQKPAAHEKASILPDAQWAVIRGGEYAFAFKGGNNGEPHNHNDVGSLTAVKNGRVILRDLGAGEYTREYFSEDRYSVFCASSFGHSVPIIDGQPQRAGAEYGAKEFSATENSVQADIGGAYGIKELKSCVREITVSENGIKITDEFKTSAPLTITERFITRDARCVECLKTENEYKTVISKHKHRGHDGSVTEVTAIDFTFEADGETKFSLDLH